jgi:succinyl-diaminopimelate desuccinylase
VMQGRIAHGSMPFLGASAIDGMARFIERLERELKPRLHSRLTQMPVEPVEARAASLNVNAIAGGQPVEAMQTPCVADLCRAVFDRRFLLEEKLDAVRAEITAILDELCQQVEVRYALNDLLVVYPTLTPAESVLVQTLSDAVISSIGRRPPLIASPGTYDQKHFARLAGVEQCVAYGPGILQLAHQPDEYCEIEHLRLSCQTLALAAMRLVGTVN